MAALQLLGMGRLEVLHEGPCEAGIGQRRGCRDRVMAPHPAAGSHLPSEGTAPPCAVAPFRVVAPCPAPQKPHTPPRPTTGFRLNPKRERIKRPISGVLLLDKPSGISSNQALQIAKRIFAARKAGHTGTLDPMATGLLPIC